MGPWDGAKFWANKKCGGFVGGSLSQKAWKNYSFQLGSNFKDDVYGAVPIDFFFRLNAHMLKRRIAIGEKKPIIGRRYSWGILRSSTWIFVNVPQGKNTKNDVVIYSLQPKRKRDMHVVNWMFRYTYLLLSMGFNGHM